MDNLLVIGAGGRAHALCSKLSEAPEVKHIFSTPGSHGIALTDKVENVSVDLKDFKKLAEWAKPQNIKMVIVGPEQPLVDGITDVLQSSGIKCFGPSSAAARIEADKDWAKAFMVKYGIPTARYSSFTDAKNAKEFVKTAKYKALVVKASGLALGKGVVVAENEQEACTAIDTMLLERKFGDAGSTVVVEELLEGEEVSVLAFTDGKTVKTMLPAQDHKRIFDNDKGDNTGGMGAYCPCPIISDDQLDWVTKNVLQKTVDGMRKEGCPFVGVLYAGMMMTNEGPKVLEFNCRFGDPETEVILPLLETNLYQVMKACCDGNLETITLKWKEGVSAVGVVMSSKGYPQTSSKGDTITGLEEAKQIPGLIVFHAATIKKGNEWMTNGGRVLVNVCLEKSLVKAAAKATQACSVINFPGAHFRTDIAHKGIPSWVLSKGKMSYKASGVDISAGDALVNLIKPTAGGTSRPGAISDLGGFGAFFDTSLAGYKDHLLVTGTDGAGTKLKIAQSCNIHDTIGIDLVAMCVNDILCHGAEPLLFLDYFACGKLEVGVADQVVAGVAKGCKIAGCALVGGETAEMPGLYKTGDYDLAGFAVGAVNKGSELPKTNLLQPGDIIHAIPSSGVHSNGFSLVRKVLKNNGLSFKDKCPFSTKSIGEELLTPTEIYVPEVLPLLRSGKIKALAHITGGGLSENIPRVLTKKLKAVINAKQMPIHKVFPWLAALGGINEKEMLRTFNCGVGLVLITSKDVKNIGIKNARIIGELQEKKAGDESVIVNNFSEALKPLMTPYVKQLVEKASKNKRIAVLISGTGTNLQTIIDSCAKGEINGEIVTVVSNKDQVMGLERAKNAGIPYKVIPHTNYSSREKFEEAIDNHLNSVGVDVVVLAGFMRILTDCFVSKWRGKLINIHPALLPSFKGTNGVKQAYDANVRITGVTVHFVEVEVDGGAIIAQEPVPIEIGESLDSLLVKISAAEKIALPRAVQHLCSDKCKLDLKSGKTLWN